MIHTAQRRLACDEAVFAEPAGATALAGVLADAGAGRLTRDETVVCIVTGSGFKDPGPLGRSDPSRVLDVRDLDRLADVAAEALTERRTG
jgi:threonine synthase